MNTTQFVSVVEHFKQHRQAQPEKAALHCLTKTIDYNTLSQNVQLWSQQLHTYGIKAGDRVAILLEKGIDFVTGMMTALELGAAYIPLDATQPIERAQLILENAKPDVLIVNELLWQKLHTLNNGNDIVGVERICITDRLIDAESKTFFSVSDMVFQTFNYPAPKAKPEDIAAILFTSGSTGVPKGVQLSHQNLSFFVDWTVKELGIHSNDVLSNHAGYHFDLSTFDIFATLTTGASCWIISSDEQRNVVALSEGIQRHQISIWYSVPSVLTMLVQADAFTADTPAPMRHIIFAGEVFPIKALCRLKDCLPAETRLHNWYGPTETNVCLAHEITEADLHKDCPAPIGVGLPGLEALLVDDDNNVLTNEGDIGELMIQGPCVTPGYTNVVDKTNNTNHQEQRHATGDLCRLEGGQFYYHGRKDRMVKVNGNRIELGEIEACLSTMPGLAEVAVLCKLTETDQQIIAFVATPEGEKPVSILKLKQFVSTRLPKYMIPNAIRRLDVLPKNPNGKTDYKQLKEMESLK